MKSVISGRRGETSSTPSRWRRLGKGGYWVVMGGLWCVLVLWMLSPWYQIKLRKDESWPHHYVFWAQKGVVPERGDLVFFNMPGDIFTRLRPIGYDRPYVRGGEGWMKQVLGVEQDVVRVQGQDVFINGELVGKGVETDKFGNPIEVASFPQVIPPGKVYLGLQTHPRSFDSRYFGLVDLEIIDGVVTPLF